MPGHASDSQGSKPQSKNGCIETMKPRPVSVSPQKRPSLSGQYPGYAQRFAKASILKQQDRSDAAPPTTGAVTQAVATGAHAQDCSPSPRPRSAPKSEPLADSADSLCGHTTSEDEPRDAASTQKGFHSDQPGYGAGVGSTASEDPTVDGSTDVAPSEKPEPSQQTGLAESHGPAESVPSNSGKSPSKAQPTGDASRHTSTAEEVEMESEASTQLPEQLPEKETAKKRLSSAKVSIKRVLAEKRSVAAAYRGRATKRVGVWVQSLSCFTSAQPPSPQATPTKLPADTDGAKNVDVLAHAYSMRDQGGGQWRIGTTAEPEVRTHRYHLLLL